MKLVFEQGVPGRQAISFKHSMLECKATLSERYKRKRLNLPCLSELDVVRHFTRLSQQNFSVDTHFYPLGSCTMKYNPKVNEELASLQGFTHIHPYQPQETVQGALQLMFMLQQYLCELTGMHAITLQPAAGAHGELTGNMIIRAFFRSKGEHRDTIIVPDSSHGTNPASSALCGFKVVTVKSDKRGNIDLSELDKVLDDNVAGLMLTNPNTLGLHDENVLEANKMVHDAGGLTYCDGANLNALMGIATPAAMGFDIIQLNLHKTFSAPHGGGGPGSGPVGVCIKLAPYLPRPAVVRKGDEYVLEINGNEKSIGRVKAYYGNFLVMVKAFAYIRALGAEGLKKATELAVVNANYLRAKLSKYYKLPYKRICKHEFVLSDEGFPNGVTTADIAKRLLDYGFHAPTVYFPLIVKGALMIEPTETESKQTLDEFIETMIKIKEEAKNQPELVKHAPHNLSVARLDAVRAARNPILRWQGES
jgi:glycine dehydrogenase subunit 2